MRSALVFVAVSLALVVAAPTAGAATHAHVFRDPAGDAKGGPDVRGVTVADKGGMVTITLGVVGLKKPAAGAATPVVHVYFDTNGDDTAEYAFAIAKTPDGPGWCFLSLADRADCLPVSGATPFSASGNTYTLRTASSDLGAATGFGFWVQTRTVTEAGKARLFDTTPTWTYVLESVKLVLGTPVLEPPVPVAGRPFRIAVPFSRSDGAPLPGGKETRVTTSIPTVGGEAVVPDDFAMHAENGVLTVSFTVPPDAAGKLLRLHVSVMSGRLGLGVEGLSTYTLNAGRSFSLRVAAPSAV